MVGLVDYIQQIGHPAGPGVVAEVEANSLARRAVLRDGDTGTGAFAVGFGGLGQISTTAKTNSPIAGFQWTSTKNLAVVKEITAFIVSFNTSAPGPTRLIVNKAASFTQQFDTQQVPAGLAVPIVGVTSGVFGAGQKLRTTMLNSDGSGFTPSHVNQLTTDTIFATVPGPTLVYASTQLPLPVSAPLTDMIGGRYTLDAVPLGAIVSSNQSSGTPPRNFCAPMQTILDSIIGPPLVLEAYTGLVFSYDSGNPGVAGGLLGYAVNIQWDEVPSFSLGNNT